MMNKIIYILSLAFVLLSCETNQMNLIPLVEVRVLMPAELKPEYTFAQKEVVLRSDRMTYTVLTDENGVARFEEIIPDIYNVYCSWNLDGDTHVEMSLEDTESRPALISAIRSKLKLFESTAFEMQTLLSIKQDLLISKVYASGTRYPDNSRYDADNYVEIFNNSDETQYVDGLFLALVEGDSPAGFPSKDNPDSIHARQLYQFPGNGTDYPVLPGRSIVIANSAANHTIAVPKSVNLLNADFEFKGTTYNNNDFVPAMRLVYTAYVSIKHLNLHRGGVNGLCLFRINDGEVEKLPIVYVPGKTSGNMFIRIPARKVFDGVEILSFRTTGVDTNLKRLQSFIDAGYTNISSTGGSNNESMERKVDKERSNVGRIYLVDTNNSQNDFGTTTVPTPRDYSKPELNR